MDVYVVEVDDQGRVRYGAERGSAAGNEEWSQPNLQERRAIIYAARQELAGLTELLEILER